ncbi:hypothetical protein P691DRAFT_766856 [Macrolepiota fuliginosa MF-IS2]|uniref:Uncharacterized protein n=1 Tax=Macrolepiota fuliginosa MF-IS2 TaxID=1400762 RepID=A0A9P5WXW2_9AGAR|nr:hypothetical protein P691DRAFT_766856 [Macrolepiota fuliginosa MF-IS2]
MKRPRSIATFNKQTFNCPTIQESIHPKALHPVQGPSTVVPPPLPFSTTHPNYPHCTDSLPSSKCSLGYLYTCSRFCGHVWFHRWHLSPILSSPAAALLIKSEGVKSFGTIESDSHVNGKSSLSSRLSVAVPPSTMSSFTSPPTASVATPIPATKLTKMDIARLIQNPSSTPSSQPASDTSSPSLHTAGLPSSSSQSTPSPQPIQSSAPSQLSQLGSHGFTPYRHPQSGASGAPCSPAYSTQQVANGSGPHSQGGPNGALSQMNAGMSSPRLVLMPHNGQPSGIPPPPQMQSPMSQQMPVP